jgi:hypothetical protein
MRVIQFNKEATDAIQGRKGGKLRIEVRDGTLFMRPTDRKAGPHVLAEIKGTKSKGVNVEITDKHLEKLGASEILADASNFGLVADKYGWMALRQDVAADDKMAVEGAQATVSIKDEPAAAEA